MKNPWAFLLAPFQRRAGERKNIAAEANRMLDLHGLRAYDEARDFARELRESGKRPDLARYWSRVAARIAHVTGREVGVKAADRYEQDRRRS